MKTNLDMSSPNVANDILRSLLVALQFGFVIYKYVQSHRCRHRKPRTRSQHPSNKKEVHHS